MFNVCPMRYLACLFWLLPVVVTASAPAGEILLQTTDGRQLTADALAPAAGGGGVDLVTERPGLRLSQTVPWVRIQAIEVNGTTYSQRELRLAIAGWSDRAEAPTAVLVSHVVPPALVYPPAPAELPPVGSHPAELSPIHPSLAGPPPVVVPPVAAPEWCWPPAEFFLAPVAPGRVIGVRDDPLSAYPEAAALYSNGIPVSEAPFALDLLRARKFSEHVPPPYAIPGPLEHPLPGFPLGRGEVPLRPLQRFEARVFPLNAAGKSDWDSLAVELIGFDRSGVETPIHGTLQATLRGERQRLIRVYDDVLDAQPLEELILGRWTRAVDEVRAAPARVTLPLSRPLPEHDLSIAPSGELRLRLLVPGSGTFETIVPDVPLAQLGALRNRRVNRQGSRFAPGDLTTGRRTSTSFRARNFSSVRPNGRILTVQP